MLSAERLQASAKNNNTETAIDANDLFEFSKLFVWSLEWSTITKTKNLLKTETSKTQKYISYSPPTLRESNSNQINIWYNSYFIFETFQMFWLVHSKFQLGKLSKKKR